MNWATFSFSNELNDFLPHWRKGKVICCEFQGNPSVKHLIESLGVPHTEVGRIFVNGSEANFSYWVQNGDHIEVYPLASSRRESTDGATSELTSPPRFILDNHLGRLATYLRMLGLDALYRNDYQDDELARLAEAEQRILLTRDRRLLMRSCIRRGYWVRAKVPREQLIEILQHFDLARSIAPFRRCIRCNTLLQPIAKEKIIDRLEPLTKKYYNEFHICPRCHQIYWKGSHYERMQGFIGQVLAYVQDEKENQAVHLDGVNEED